MFTWIKNLFKNPKSIAKFAIDALDTAVPFIAEEIDKVKTKFQAASSVEQAQMVVDRVQVYLRKWAGIVDA